MQYPEEFKEKCRTVYPGWKALHRQLERGSESVGRYLVDSKGLRITHREMLSLLKSDRVETVIIALESAIARDQLYEDWVKTQQV